MKRRVDESSIIKEGSGPYSCNLQYRPPTQSPASGVPPLPLSYASSGAVKGPAEVMQSGIFPQVTYAMPAAQAPLASAPQQPPSNFHRLKVEDALSYLDLVKYKFNNKPQVYNDFLDIMKEFKSQSIDTPGVIQRVSNLFKGFPDLIVGFNTFLPPGYKIEVQRSDQGYAFQVSVSMPSPTGTMQSDSAPQKSSMILKGSGIINMSAGGGHPPPGPPPVTQPITSSAQSHLAPVAPQPPAVHHTPSYGGAPPYNSMLSAAQAAVTQALQGHSEPPQNQPVEFNHAINYVNKIKHRFQGQPEKYKRFLEILHAYQKEQRTLKEAGGAMSAKPLTEQEVYSQVAKLFENQSDLLAEFGQFLPDATSHIHAQPLPDPIVKKPPSKPSYREHNVERHLPHKTSHIPSNPVKRSPPYSNMMHRDAPPPKKHKPSSCRDVTLAEAGKFGTLNDYAFFDKVRKAVRTPEAYNSFLRCLNLFNQEIVSKSELVQMVTPFLGKFPELLRWFREFLGQNESEALPYSVARNDRPQGELAVEIDLTTAKRLGASYCVIPVAQEGLKCSGRTTLCQEVLNDQWVSFPTWSEDSTFVSSRKTQYEEYMYRCEDERFELDVVIETNAATIRVLEAVQKKLSRMSQDEISRFTLADSLGGSSDTLHRRAIRRIYGEKAQDIIDGLKRNPVVAVPVVLRRLKTKEEEWREAQKGFNKIWREQNEKYYLKSLDHQGINFKQTDVKALRSKSLFNEIETIFDERHEQNEEGAEPIVGPHVVFPYRDRTILDDAANLLIHNVKRQTGVQKSEKRRIKHLLLQFLPDFFFHARQALSEDEREDEDDKDETEESPGSSPSNKESKGSASPGKSPARSDNEPLEVKMDIDVKDEDIKVPLHAQTNDPEESYAMFMANTNWYIFLRLHAILCERLTKIYERAVILAAEEQKQRTTRKESIAVALRLKPKPQIEVEDYYPTFLEMVKKLLDGNMDANTYEDTLREMFGIHAYIAFTLDKVVLYAVRQLQHCVTERSAIACTDMFVKEQKRGANVGTCATAYKRVNQEQAYQRAAEKAAQDDSCFKIFFYKNDCRMSIELLDTESETDNKKVEETRKWSSYKESFTECSSTDKLKTPVFLGRNLRTYYRRFGCDKKNNNQSDVNSSILSKSDDSPRQSQSSKRVDGADEFQEKNETSTTDCDKKYEISLQELERKLNERSIPERNQTNHPGFDVNDDTECKFNPQDSKIMFTVNKDSYLYKISAFSKAKQSHPEVTKRLANRFRSWLKQWVSANVSDSQHKQCNDWLMGRGDGLVPNRTRVLTDNDIARTPYTAYNRYRVERLNEDSS